MQRAGPDTTSDGETVQPDPHELSPGDHTMLPAGEPRYGLAPLRWHGIVADSATYPCHLVRMAGWALRRSSLCDGTATPGARAVRLAARPAAQRDRYSGRAGRKARRAPGRSQARLDQERDDQQGHDVRDLDHRVDRGAGGVLVGVADRVARDRGR